MASLLLTKITPALSDISQIKWIEQDMLLDLMFEICNVLYENGLHDTSFKLEFALDAFLVETNRSLSVAKTGTRRRTSKQATNKIFERHKASASNRSSSNMRPKRLHRNRQRCTEVDNIFADLWDAP